MAQKKKPDVDSVREKAAQMRLAQERADRRVRIIVIACVAVIVLAVVGAVGAVIWQQRAQVNAASNVDATEILGPYADGRPIVINGSGVSSEADPNLPTLTEYFDYSCHACADLDAALGHDLTTWASEGRFNLEIQPVITVDMSYHKVASGASLVVAQKAPDKWIDFHHALMAYFRTQYQASNGSVVQNLEASWKQVKQIATEVGVPSDVVETFPLNAVDSYLQASANAWKDAGYTGRDNGLGTPEFVKDRTRAIPLGTKVSTLRDTIMAEYGIVDGSSQSGSSTPDTTADNRGGNDQGQSSSTAGGDN